MPFFSSIFRNKDAAAKKHAKQNGMVRAEPPKPRWEDAWQRTEVEAEEIQELLRECTFEIKSRALDMPFLLLPFRPASDPSAARTFIRNFFNPSPEKGGPLTGERLAQELRLIEPLVLCSVMKWCWSRLAGGVVTWEAYELFKIGEQDSNTARDAFATFIPISVASEARTKIIFDFFDLMAAIAAHGKTNGMGGRKLSRLGGWWAFEHTDTGNGFDGGYKVWSSAADATSHLFFAYLRSLSPDSVQGTNGISALPLSLQSLLNTTEYPPVEHYSTQARTARVVMIVDTVSPTPFALLRRAKHFEYRDDDEVLQQFSNYDDPIQALTEECRRVLKSISSANDSSTSKASTSLKDASWSRFEDVGFGGLGDESDYDDEIDGILVGRKHMQQPQGLRTKPQSGTDFGRPTTPSWADFLSSGFVDDGNKTSAPLLLPPDKILPPINTRGQSSQSHKRNMDNDSHLEPGELASITSFYLDDAFWWVWITSLAGEEPLFRKAVFGRCALIETSIRGNHWLVMEEIIKGAAPEPDATAYIAEKKSRFGFSKRGKLTRTKSTKNVQPLANDPYLRNARKPLFNKTNIAPAQHARIQAAAVALQQKHSLERNVPASPRRARQGEAMNTKTSSIFTLQPVIMSEAAPALQWANSYDKNAIRAKYLGDHFAGIGSTGNLSTTTNGVSRDKTPTANGSISPLVAPKPTTTIPRSESYGFPQQVSHVGNDNVKKEIPPSRNQQALPEVPKESAPITPAESPMPTPMPAPPPHLSANQLHNSNEVAAEASMIPLPTTTPMEYARPMERKPLPPPKQPTPPAEPDTFVPGPEYSIQPEFPPSPDYSTVPDYPQSPVTNMAASMDSSPESQYPGGKKLKKKGGASGFKGLFGRKKPEPVRPPPSTSPASTTAVAAARAALEAKQKSSQTPSHPADHQTKGIRRLSAVPRKQAPEPPAPISVAAPTQVPELSEDPPTSTADPTPQVSPRFPKDIYASQASLSRVDTDEQRHAEHEFRTFDQGPLAEQPASVPDYSARSSSEVEDHPTLSNGEPLSTVPESSTLHNDTKDDNASEKSLDLTRHISPVQDRWAQIRKNAAERAARQSEEQSRQTDRTEDGETSGEETIESRVARIKARVAELTGNMEAPSVARR